MNVLKHNDQNFVIGKDEILYRIIDFPSGVVKGTEDQVDPKAFRLYRKNEHYISMISSGMPQRKRLSVKARLL